MIGETFIAYPFILYAICNNIRYIIIIIVLYPNLMILSLVKPKFKPKVMGEEGRKVIGFWDK